MNTTFSQFLNESKQVGTVYHFTQFGYLMNILETDFLTASGTYWGNDNFIYAISTTRDKNFVKIRNNLSIGGGEVALVLDGNKMSTQFKSKPIDDKWNKDEKKYKTGKYFNYGDEQEEVWYGNKITADRGIKGIRKYIKKIIFTNKLAEFLKVRGGGIGFDRINVNIEWSNDSSTTQRMTVIADYIKNKYNIEVEF